MKFTRIIGILIVMVVLVAWGLILLKPSRRPDLMNVVAGCYRGNEQLEAILLMVSPSGALSVQGETLKAVIAEDKTGISFLPDRRISYDPKVPNRLTIGAGSPLLLRISDDRRSITIPTKTPNVVFRKVDCSSGGATVQAKELR